MNTKFEQLLDYLVNEEMDKANELFHEIVVEKSRDIYQNLINEEEDEEEDMDESMHDEEVDESMDDEDMDESMHDEEELEDSYSVDMDEVEGDDTDDMMGSDDNSGPIGGDETDDMLSDVESDSTADELYAEIDRVMDMLSDFKDKVDDLAGSKDDTVSLDTDDEDDFAVNDDEEEEEEDEEEKDEEDTDNKSMFEGRRLTREYREKVGNDWEKNSQKAQGKAAGADTGEKMGSPAEGKSPIASGKNKPGPAGVNGKNLNQGATEGQSNTGTSPGKVTKGLAPHSSERMAAGLHNVDGVTSGVKTLSKVAKGHGAEKGGSGPGPVGSGTGDKAGQTSVGKIPQFLKPAK